VYDWGMRASVAALICAALVTCTRAEPPKTEESAAPPFDAVPSALLPPAPPPPAATAGGPFWEPIPTGRAVPILRADAPNMRYAAMDGATCEAELARRHVDFVPAQPTPGVLAPVRLRGPLAGGVSIHSALPEAARAKAAMEIFDCRLVLALDDFSAMVAKHGVVTMIHLSAYRPRKQFGCTRKYAGKQHCAALAVDIARFERKDGTALVVQRDWHGRVGRPTCPARPNELWSIVCDAADRALFNVMLTPNFNAQHFNHIHVEITPDAGWMLVH
jgi:hypothetical protein